MADEVRELPDDVRKDLRNHLESLATRLAESNTKAQSANSVEDVREHGGRSLAYNEQYRALLQLFPGLDKYPPYTTV